MSVRATHIVGNYFFSSSIRVQYRCTAQYEGIPTFSYLLIVINHLFSVLPQVVKIHRQILPGELSLTGKT